jgi:hypothetical protein
MVTVLAALVLAGMIWYSKSRRAEMLVPGTPEGPEALDASDMARQAVEPTP